MIPISKSAMARLVDLVGSNSIAGEPEIAKEVKIWVSAQQFCKRQELLDVADYVCTKVHPVTATENAYDLLEKRVDYIETVSRDWAVKTPYHMEAIRMAFRELILAITLDDHINLLRKSKETKAYDPFDL